MFGPRIRLIKLLGFPVEIDLSWLVIAVLITWSLAVGYFPSLLEGLPAAAYWWMGAAGAFGLFASIVLHELGHAVVARHYGMAIERIVLFIFGGVAVLRGEPPSARVELHVALAGPLVSALLAVAFFGAGILLPLPPPAIAVFGYLSTINVVVIVFNMIPAFPLDGGRVLRSLLWAWKGSLRQATRITSSLGSGFGLGFVLLGVLLVVRGMVIQGIWLGVIGLFLRNAATMSYRQLLVRGAFEGEPIARFMTERPVVVPRHLPISELVDDYVYRFHHKLYPVVDADRLVGCVSTQRVRSVPREEWPRRTVGEIADACGPENTVSPTEDALEALARMSRSKSSRLMVVDGEALVGIVSLKDLLDFMSLKLELEGGEGPGD